MSIKDDFMTTPAGRLRWHKAGIAIGREDHLWQQIPYRKLRVIIDNSVYPQRFLRTNGRAWQRKHRRAYRAAMRAMATR